MWRHWTLLWCALAVLHAQNKSWMDRGGHRRTLGELFAILEANRRLGTNADLRSADLSGADLCGTNQSSVDLAGAMLQGADLYGANLRDANLSRAYLSRAILSQA